MKNGRSLEAFYNIIHRMVNMFVFHSNIDPRMPLRVSTTWRSLSKCISQIVIIPRNVTQYPHNLQFAIKFLVLFAKFLEKCHLCFHSLLLLRFSSFPITIFFCWLKHIYLSHFGIWCLKSMVITHKQDFDILGISIFKNV